MEGPPGSLPTAPGLSVLVPMMSGLKRRERIFPQPGPWPAWEATASSESGSCFKQVIKALISVAPLGGGAPLQDSVGPGEALSKPGL